MNDKLKQLWPHLVVVAVFITVTFAYLSPLLKGKTLVLGDISNFKGMAQEMTEWKDKTGEHILWTNSMFGGMPTYQISAANNTNLLSYVDKAFSLFLPRPADYLVLSMLGFYLLMCVLKVDKWWGAIAAIAYTFGSYFIISILTGHTSKVHAMAYIAPIIASVILTYRGKYLLGGALTMLFLSLQLYCNHFQITYYTIIFCFILAVALAWENIKNQQLSTFIRASVVSVAAGLLALLPNATQLWLTYDYGKYTTRGKSELTIPSPSDGADAEAAKKNNQTGGLPRDYITAWSNGVGETFMLLIPNFKGGESAAIANVDKKALKEVDSGYRQQIGGSSAYFGEQPFSGGPTYAGAIVIFFFVLGLFFVKGPLKWAILVGTLISIMFSWGSNFNGLTNFLIDNLPGYNKFRSVSMNIVVANVLIPVLGLWAIFEMVKIPDFLNQPFSLLGKETKLKNLHMFILAFVLTGGLSLAMYAAPKAFNTFITQTEQTQLDEMAEKQPDQADAIANYIDNLETARIALFKPDALRSGLLVLVAAVVLFLFFKLKFDTRILAVILGVLIVGDLFMLDQRYIDKKNFISKEKDKVPFPKTTAFTSLENDKDPNFRSLNLAASTFNDASLSFYNKSIGGYHGAKLKRYQQLIEFRLQKEIGFITTTLRAGGITDSVLKAMFNGVPTLNMLNTKYLVVNPDAPALRNPAAFGNAWFVNEIKWVANPDSEIVALNTINPRTTAAIDKVFEADLKGFNPVADSTASIKLTSYSPVELQYETNAAKDQLAVFSEIYYKNGWNAYLDGKLVPHQRANFVLRAMQIPAGNHKVVFKFEPEDYAKGQKISLAGSGLLLLLVALALFLSFRKNKEEKAA